MNTSVTTTSAQFMNQLSWFSENNKHRLKLTSELRHDAYAQDLTTNLLGTFSYNSLADLEAGTAGAVHAAALAARARAQASYVGGAVARRLVSADDATCRSSTACALDANRFTSRADAQPDVERAVRRRATTTAEPALREPAHRLLVDVRHRRRRSAAFEGAVRGPRAVVRGGIGLFQNTPNTQLDRRRARQHRVCRAACSSSRASARRRRRPTGRRTARTRRTIPIACADGTTGTVFAQHRAERHRCSTRLRRRRAACARTCSGAAPISDNRFARRRRDLLAEPEPGEASSI